MIKSLLNGQEIKLIFSLSKKNNWTDRRKQSEKFFEIREEQLKNVMASQSTLAGKLIGISSNNDFKMLDDLTNETK